MAEIIEQHWKKICNGPEKALVKPQTGEPGRDVEVNIYDTATLEVNCNNFQQGKCAIGSTENDICIFAGVLSETQRAREEYVYRAINTHPGISQTELMDLLGGSRPAISREVTQLVARDIVKPGEVVHDKQPGRPKRLYYVPWQKRNLLE